MIKMSYDTLEELRSHVESAQFYHFMNKVEEVENELSTLWDTLTDLENGS